MSDNLNVRLNLTTYQYVGPVEIRQRVVGQARGAIIRHARDLELLQESMRQGELVFTFVVDQEQRLCLADRHSEHVACAGGEPVLCAGEIWLAESATHWVVTDVTNQSTGYCPEPVSWSVLAGTLDVLGIEHPGRFTREFIFRRCPQCQQINVVKDDWYVCPVCETDLPKEWNCLPSGHHSH